MEEELVGGGGLGEVFLTLTKMGVPCFSLVFNGCPSFAEETQSSSFPRFLFVCSRSLGGLVGKPTNQHYRHCSLWFAIDEFVRKLKPFFYSFFSNLIWVSVVVYPSTELLVFDDFLVMELFMIFCLYMTQCSLIFNMKTSWR